MPQFEVTPDENGNEDQEWIQDQDGNLIARIYGPWSAHLFASAPELLKACEDALEWIKIIGAEEGRDYPALERRMKTAIARAKKDAS